MNGYLLSLHNGNGLIKAEKLGEKGKRIVDLSRWRPCKLLPGR